MKEEKQNILEMKNIDKRFPGVHALDNCSFSLREGEIHALIGENGAGKSTLVKIMTGIYSDFEGTYMFNGQQVHFNSIKEAQQAGISIVHQELNMMNDLTVAQNIFIGRESKGFFCSDKKINEMTENLIREFDINVSATDILSNLSVGKAQMVEIARAMSFESTKILILDEPTAALSEAEAEDLFKKMKKLKEKGVSIIFISHRLGEIMRVADRVTVMRDGAYIDTLQVKECTVDNIIRLMVGRDIIEEPKQHSNVKENAPIVMEVKNLCSSKVKNISFHLRKGEILGFAGLVGAGRTETMRLLCGADNRSNGEIMINGKLTVMKHPKDAITNGICYLSEDRKRYGLVLGLSVTENTVLASYQKLSRFGFVKEKDCEEKMEGYVKKLRIKTPSGRQIVKNLSGGNQQKVVIAKWLLRDMDILIFDEPTRGIDVGARAEIYHLMDELVAQGKSIIMVSSDLTEVLRMSDRVAVMCEGMITGELSIEEANQNNIMTLATKHEIEG
ncbi:MAG: sugar ABC transporter ATP-binding protein [Lachnospiraceae bacterium]|nr:sugar ABC transporter ATP-binding protein [Lachnospiraceae bacterium]